MSHNTANAERFAVGERDGPHAARPMGGKRRDPGNGDGRRREPGERQHPERHDLSRHAVAIVPFPHEATVEDVRRDDAAAHGHDVGGPGREMTYDGEEHQDRRAHRRCPDRDQKAARDSTECGVHRGRSAGVRWRNRRRPNAASIHVTPSARSCAHVVPIAASTATNATLVSAIDAR